MSISIIIVTSSTSSLYIEGMVVWTAMDQIRAASSFISRIGK